MARGREVEVKFRRDLGLLEITMIGLGPTIGTTIFLLVGPGYAITGPSLILAFGLNFVVPMFTAMPHMELGSAFPAAGGGYLWIRRAMRDPWGFLVGWSSCSQAMRSSSRRGERCASPRGIHRVQAALWSAFRAWLSSGSRAARAGVRGSAAVARVQRASSCRRPTREP